MIEMFLDHGADPYLRNTDNGRNAFQMAAYHGRGDILRNLEQRGFAPNFEGPTPDARFARRRLCPRRSRRPSMPSSPKTRN